MHALKWLFVKVGDSVKEGDPIACVCAMKMEVKVVAQADCTVGSFAVGEGDKVIGGALMAILD